MSGYGEGDFANDWLEFERELGYRPNLRGNLDQIIETYNNKLGADLVSKFTFPAPDPSLKTEDKTLDGVPCRIYTPQGYEGNKPVCVYFHGGGWAMGDLDGDDGNCRVISKGAGIVLVSVGYRLAPQHPYPAPLDDCLTAANWVLSNASSLSGADGKVILAGASAGGGLALGVALKLVDAGKRDRVVGIVAQVPATVHADGVPEKYKSGYESFKKHANDTVNTADAMHTFWDAYGAPPTDKYAYPLNHEKLGSLPKTYISIAGQDTLRDDGRLLAKALTENGVPNKVDEYQGYPHYFWTFPAKCLEGVAKKYNDNVVKGTKWILEGKESNL